jgi:hypothetical protein
MHHELKQAFLSKVKNHVKVVHESRTQVIVLNFGVIDLLNQKKADNYGLTFDQGTNMGDTAQQLLITNAWFFLLRPAALPPFSVAETTIVASVYLAAR